MFKKTNNNFHALRIHYYEGCQYFHKGEIVLEPIEARKKIALMRQLGIIIFSCGKCFNKYFKARQKRGEQVF